MSRSRRHTPIKGVTTAASDKRFKTHAHRAERASARHALADGSEVPHRKAFGDPWKGKKDGKTYIDAADIAQMRK